MLHRWQIRVYEKQQLVYAEEGAGPLELGRQESEHEAGPYTTKTEGGRRRIVIARLDEDTVSRQHALLEPLAEGRLRLTNLSRKLPVHRSDGGELRPGACCELSLPTVLTLGRKTVRVQLPEKSLQSLAQATVPPGRISVAVAFPTPLPAGEGLDVESLLRWLQAALSVVQSAAGSADFFLKAARAVVDLVGLDSGRVLMRDQQGWQVEAIQTARGSAADPEWEPSRRVLQHVFQEKRTFWETPEQIGPDAASLSGVTAVVVAPILDRQGQVIGALYGERRRGAPLMLATPITQVEAMLVELLAGGVAAGLARLEQERAASAARVQFEEFFTPELSRHLAAQPDLLAGKDCPVTVLFCDIRGFSRISERLGQEVGPAQTIDWLRDVLGVLSDCVLDRRGVLVDYSGDELMAMWGAPEEQPDHARLACRAALDMLEHLPELSARWQPLLQQPITLGIGINTGVARVGNTGSRRKFKYGPHGNTVNVASRVQGATKYLRTSVLLTGATQRELDDSFETRRLGRVEVVNIAEPVELYEMVLPGLANWRGLKEMYEKALAAFEQRSLHAAARMLSALLSDHPEDAPSLVLLNRAVQALVDVAAEFQPVWKLPGK
jgi:adenylate cyclase